MHNYRRFIDSILTHNPARPKTKEKADGHPIIVLCNTYDDAFYNMFGVAFLML